MMDKPSSQIQNPNDFAVPANTKDDPIDPRLIADSLLSALSSGNLEQLEHAREAFVKESPHSNRDRQPPDLSAQLERRSIELLQNLEHRPVVVIDQARRETDFVVRRDAEKMLVEYIRKLHLPNAVIVSPDVGGAKRVGDVARLLDLPIAFVYERLKRKRNIARKNKPNASRNWKPCAERRKPRLSKQPAKNNY